MSRGDHNDQHHIEWTPEQIAELRRLWDSGLETREIADLLGTTKNSVVGKAHRLHLTPRPSPIKRSVAWTAPKHTRAGKDKGVTPGVPTNTRKAPPKERAKLGTPIPEAIKPPKRFDGLPVSAAQCSWPIGDPGDADYHTCPDRALVKKPYCAEHCAASYVKVPR